MASDATNDKVKIQTNEINAALTMQIATLRDTKPWICTVYFVVVNERFYWLSYPERRHSQELSHHPDAAVAIVLHPAQPVVGVQAEGDVEVVNDVSEVKIVLDRYIEKYNQGNQFLQHFIAGTNKHLLYCFIPRRVRVFDERKTRHRNLPEAEAVIV